MPEMSNRPAPSSGPASNAADDTTADAAAGLVGGSRPLLCLWHPQDPNQLVLPSISTESSQEASSKSTGLVGALRYGVAEVQSSDCTEFEQLALTRILEAHAGYHNYDREPSDHAQTPRRGKEGAEARFLRIQDLSRQYVLSIRDCVEGWEAAITRRRMTAMTARQGSANEDNMDVEVNEEDLENLMMLKYVYGLVALSSTYLRFVSPLSPLCMRGGVGPWDYPGLVSADLVRFLRETYPIMKDRQPQEVLGRDDIPGTDDVVDWEMVRSFVLRGLLEPAWLCLQRDPIYLAAKQEISYVGLVKDGALMRSYQGIVEDTEVMGVLLLLAPLPGGRAVTPLDDGQVEQMIEELVECDSVSDLRPSDAMGWDAAGDGYSHREANRKHQLWQRAVREYIQVRKTLEYKRVEFDPLLSVMAGNLRDVRFESWAGELCATVLYKTPSMTPHQVSDCAARIAGDSKYLTCDNENNVVPVQTTDLVPFRVVEGLLSIMNGRVGDAICLLWTLGGWSGAALNSVITTLMYTLSIEAGVAESSGSVPSMEKADLLSRSSSAILSSVDRLQATQLSIQLMMPYALEDGSSELVEAIAAALDRCSLPDYSFVSPLIDLCRPLLERRAADVMDGCCSLLLSCYRDQLCVGRYGDAIFCLRKGVELEALVLSGEALSEGSCYRTLTGVCNRAVEQLADDFLSRDGFLKQGDTSAVVDMAESMIEGLDSDSSSDLTSFIPSVRVLRSVAAGCGGGIPICERANRLVACLRPEVRSNGRARRSVASPSLCWRLMQMSHKVLLEVERIGNQVSTDPTPALDVGGVTVLMKQLGELRSLERAKPPCARRYSESDMAEIERGLVLALKRAYVGKQREKSASDAQRQASKPKDQGYFSFLLGSNDKKMAAVDSMLSS